MALVTHILARVVPRDARPLGTSFIAVWLILSGQVRASPRPRPGRSAFYFRLRGNFTFNRLQKKEKTKADTPRPPLLVYY